MCLNDTSVWVPESAIIERLKIREEKEKEVAVGIKNDHQPNTTRFQTPEFIPPHQHTKDPDHTQTKTDTVTYIPTHSQIMQCQDHMIYNTDQ